ncbi:S-adenosyl-L-methionine-dependent methyltransferase [Catenaria anguillulae PL171]|uniref:S-adenosyl-L-methionine-dependent methyltransferase n=1 Tax=Catenaria anguillulae PL171 TaxID=765915 RepID=A0A1Y2HWR5_9FUNG|nr:S-adenosyl-L-methionine-dependent methyltransferase [Catenaria anguillulae PL171]
MQAAASAAAAAAQTVSRIRLANLNKFFNKKDTLKWLTKVPELSGESAPAWISQMSLKKSPKSDMAFITLPTDELHKEALAALRAATLICRNREVIVKEFVDKVKVHAPKPVDPNDTRTPLERVADQTTPFWRMDYDEQLAQKHTTMETAVSEALRKSGVDKASVQILEPVASPIVDGYRSKCEFQIGLGVDGLPTVGFNGGNYLSGQWAVINPRGLKHVNETMLSAVDIIQAFIRTKPDLPVWDKGTKTGFFRLALMRTTSLGETMYILQLDPRTYEPEQLLALESEFQRYFTTAAAAANIPVTVLGVQYFSGTNDMFPHDEPVKVLVGDKDTIEETLCGFQFSISPTSFFQINKPATEVLYGMVRDWALEVDQSIPAPTSTAESAAANAAPKKKILLDLCCGTGTIGICMSTGNFDKIYGVDIVSEAITNAKANAARNSVTNAEYTAAPVEKYLPGLLNSAEVRAGAEVIAVLDPPRPGVNKAVIKAIRTCPAIRRVVFVSCDIKQVQTNLMDLMREATGSHPGARFTMHRCQVVDLFPHTKHMEVVMEFRRVDEPAAEKEQAETEAIEAQPEKLETTEGEATSQNSL